MGPGVPPPFDPLPDVLGWLVELDNPFTKTNRAAVIVQRLDVHPGMTVLDFGCGPGRLAIPLGKVVGPQGEVVAVDIAAGMLDRAREKHAPRSSPTFAFFRRQRGGQARPQSVRSRLAGDGAGRAPIGKRR